MITTTSALVGALCAVKEARPQSELASTMVDSFMIVPKYVVNSAFAARPRWRLAAPCFGSKLLNPPRSVKARASFFDP